MKKLLVVVSTILLFIYTISKHINFITNLKFDIAYILVNLAKLFVLDFITMITLILTMIILEG